MYKLILFDLDGTILNTIEDLADSTNYALRVNNMPERTIDEVLAFVGNGYKRLIELAVTDTSLTDRVLADFKEYYSTHNAVKTRPYDGIIEVISKLRSLGCITAVVSNKGDEAVKDLCKLYFPNLFDISVGEREGIRRKPYPDSVLEVINTLNIDPKDAIYIGDSEVDVQTAKNAGLEEIAVCWGFRTREQLIESGATTLAETTDELLQLLTK